MQHYYQCNEYFSKLLEFMDKNKMWDDTCVIFTTDHGFMLEEHGWWGRIECHSLMK